MMLKSAFVESWNNLQKRTYQIAKDHGWWEGEQNKAEKIALAHSELSEALEYLRHNNPLSDHIPEFSGVEEELADLVIRVMDMSQAYGYRVAEAILAKTNFNEDRPYKHGKKF